MINIGTDIDLKSHLLIGGESGSGKSVAMNGLIIECLMDNPQNEVYLFDPKLVEFNRYKNIAPVFTKIADMSDALSSLHRVMMDRYDIMSDSGLVEWSDGHIYIFIDEYGAIKNYHNKVIAKKIQNIVEDIAMMGRAAGVHLIIATQYPTREVVNMQLKMNCQKLVLRCNSDIGYRVMSDKKYYDLKGNGDAYLVDAQSRVTRFQVNYYSNELVTEFIKECEKYYHI